MFKLKLLILCFVKNNQEVYVENLDNGKLFDILYQDETKILKLDLIKEVADGRRLYPLID